MIPSTIKDMSQPPRTSSVYNESSAAPPSPSAKSQVTEKDKAAAAPVPVEKPKAPLAQVTTASGLVLSEALLDAIPWLSGADDPLALEGRIGVAVTGGRYRLVATCAGGALVSFGRRVEWGVAGRQCHALIEWQDEAALATWVSVRHAHIHDARAASFAVSAHDARHAPMIARVPLTITRSNWSSTPMPVNSSPPHAPLVVCSFSSVCLCAHAFAARR
eukprot:4584666-Prymnesium_polylepis.1